MHRPIDQGYKYQEEEEGEEEEEEEEREEDGGEGGGGGRAPRHPSSARLAPPEEPARGLAGRDQRLLPEQTLARPQQTSLLACGARLSLVDLLRSMREIRLLQTQLLA